MSIDLNWLGRCADQLEASGRPGAAVALLAVGGAIHSRGIPETELLDLARVVATEGLRRMANTNELLEELEAARCKVQSLADDALQDSVEDLWTKWREGKLKGGDS